MDLFRKLRKPRFLLVYPLAAWIFVFAHTTKLSFCIGMVFVLFGELIRLWANGYVGHAKVNWTDHEQGQPKIGCLITAGPYAFIRHPLYFGSLLIGFGILVIAGNPWLMLMAPMVFILIYRRKMVEEEETLRHEWSQEVEPYQRMVPRWLPTGWRYPHRSGHWSWQGILASKEPKTSAWVGILLILLFFRMELIQNRHRLLQPHGSEHVCLLGLLVVLIVVDGIFELARRAKTRSNGVCSRPNSHRLSASRIAPLKARRRARASP